MFRYGAIASLLRVSALTAQPSRRTALVLSLCLAAALGGCGRRGGLELPGETPSPVGGPTPPNLPQRSQGSPDPTNPAQRTPESANANPAQRNYDRDRPVGRNPMLPSGRFILDPLL
jgi:predicted small lipoprotein YifL